MSLAAYTKSISSNSVGETIVKIESPAVHQLHIQMRANWIRDERTKEVFKEISDEYAKLETEARALAMQFQQHQNPHGIIQRLIRAEELRNIIKNYGRIDPTEK
jgi:hypothetical protein